MPQQYRYPGAKPFEEKERSLFFGRENDIRTLFDLLSVEQLLVLYGKSGLGKTSLLRAGLTPLLEEDENYLPFVLRFGSYQPESNTDLSQIFIHKTSDGRNAPPTLIKTLKPDDQSLWAQCKAYQMQYTEKRTFVLIFDQFEELFTYPKKSLDKFKRELSELLHTKIPQRYRNALRGALSENPDQFDEAMLHKFHQPMDVRAILAIRSDQLSLLNQFTDYFPDILRECYELEPLDKEEAEDAIENPASHDPRSDNEGYISEPFTYSNGALNSIVEFLTNSNTKKIESFQLQILCQYVEQLVINEDSRNKLEKNKNGYWVINRSDLGDLESIYQNYYDNQIERIGTPKEQEAARLLIEEGLIFEDEERRLRLYEGQIRGKYGVSKELIGRLIDTHLLRAEPTPNNGVTFELSHDTLVKPILRSKARRKEEEHLRRKEAQIKKRQELTYKERKRWLVTFIASVLSVVGIIGIVTTFYFKKQASELDKALKSIEQEKQRADNEHQQYINYKDSLNKTSEGRLRTDLLLYQDSLRKTKNSRDSIQMTLTDNVLEMTAKVANVSLNSSVLKKELDREREKNRELESFKTKMVRQVQSFEDLVEYADRSPSRQPPWFRALKKNVYEPMIKLTEEEESR